MQLVEVLAHRPGPSIFLFSRVTIQLMASFCCFFESVMWLLGLFYPIMPY